MKYSIHILLNKAWVISPTYFCTTATLSYSGRQVFLAAPFKIKVDWCMHPQHIKLWIENSNQINCMNSRSIQQSIDYLWSLLHFQFLLFQLSRIVLLANGDSSNVSIYSVQLEYWIFDFLVYSVFTLRYLVYSVFTHICSTTTTVYLVPQKYFLSQASWQKSLPF